MSITGCSYKCGCTVYAIAVSAVIAILSSFLQITGVFTVTPVILWAALAIAVVSLWVTGITAALSPNRGNNDCRCAAMDAHLLGILGTILLSIILLVVGIVATSVVSAILVGLLAFFFALTITNFICYVRKLQCCGE